MKIGTRLIFLLVFAIAALLVVGGVGMWAFQYSNREVRKMTDFSIPSIQAMYDVGIAYRDSRALLFAHIQEADVDLKKASDGNIAKARDFAQRVVNGYENLVIDDEQRENAKALKTTFGAYLTAFDEAHRQSSANDGSAAQATLFSKVLPASYKLEDVLKKATEHDVKAQEMSAQNVSDVYANSVKVFGIVIVLSIITLALFGYFLARAVRVPLGILESTVERIGRELDFSQRVPIDSRDEVGMTVQAFNRLLDNLQASFKEIAAGAQSVAGRANEMADASKQMSQGASAASESSSHMAATVEQVTVSIAHVADRAGEADALSRRSGAVAREGEAVIRSTVEEINAISNSVDNASVHIDALARESANISAVVGVIRDVAEQTNLLALNAAIEAARAGEQGRGFAVVADEVRKLAERTSVSTKEIAGLITNIQNGASGAVSSMKEVVERVELGVRKARLAGETIQQIQTSSGQVVEMVADISHAIQEQSTASTEMSRQVEKIALMSEEASGASNSTTKAAVALQSLAHQMQSVVGRYKL